MNYIWNLTDLKNINKNGYKVFSCFSCGGGSSMGYKLAGFEVVGNCEIDKNINKMYLKNFDVKYNYEMGVQDFKNLKDLPEELYNIDVLDGSPPCSTFSLAGEREKNWGKEKKFREGQEKQVLSDLFFDFIDIADKLKPKMIIAENVKGIILGNAKGYINEILKRLNNIGYDIQIFLLNAATMGVPQRRERVFFICRRKDLNLPKIELNFNEKPILYKEFADKKCRLFNKDTLFYKRWLKRINTDKSLGDVVKRTEKGKISQFNNVFIKLNAVSPTITAGGHMVRYDLPGSLSDYDIKTICTFPQDYNFNGQSVQYVCGMSVPPIMMFKIATEVKKILDKIKEGD